MKHRQTTITLLFLTLATLLLLTGCDASTNASQKSQEAEKSTEEPPPAPTSDAAPQPDTVTVYYFHGDRRCPTCLGIQNGIERTLQERFPSERSSGKLEFKEINIDQDANKHFIQQFQISFSTLIVAAKTGETTVKWENCDGVWKHARNPESLMNYTEEKIRHFLAMLKE